MKSLKTIVELFDLVPDSTPRFVNVGGGIGRITIKRLEALFFEKFERIEIGTLLRR